MHKIHPSAIHEDYSKLITQTPEVKQRLTSVGTMPLNELVIALHKVGKASEKRSTSLREEEVELTELLKAFQDFSVSPTYIRLMKIEMQFVSQPEILKHLQTPAGKAEVAKLSKKLNVMGALERGNDILCEKNKAELIARLLIIYGACLDIKAQMGIEETQEDKESTTNLSSSDQVKLLEFRKKINTFRDAAFVFFGRVFSEYETADIDVQDQRLKQFELIKKQLNSGLVPLEKVAGLQNVELLDETLDEKKLDINEIRFFISDKTQADSLYNVVDLAENIIGANNQKAKMNTTPPKMSAIQLQTSVTKIKRYIQWIEKQKAAIKNRPDFQIMDELLKNIQAAYQDFNADVPQSELGQLAAATAATIATMQGLWTNVSGVQANIKPEDFKKHILLKEIKSSASEAKSDSEKHLDYLKKKKESLLETLTDLDKAQAQLNIVMTPQKNTIVTHTKVLPAAPPPKRQTSISGSGGSQLSTSETMRSSISSSSSLTFTAEDTIIEHIHEASIKFDFFTGKLAKLIGHYYRTNLFVEQGDAYAKEQAQKAWAQYKQKFSSLSATQALAQFFQEPTTGEEIKAAEETTFSGFWKLRLFLLQELSFNFLQVDKEMKANVKLTEDKFSKPISLSGLPRLPLNESKSACTVYDYQQLLKEEKYHLDLLQAVEKEGATHPFAKPCVLFESYYRRFLVRKDRLAQFMIRLMQRPHFIDKEFDEETLLKIFNSSGSSDSGFKLCLEEALTDLAYLCRWGEVIKALLGHYQADKTDGALILEGINAIITEADKLEALLFGAPASRLFVSDHDKRVRKVFSDISFAWRSKRAQAEKEILIPGVPNLRKYEGMVAQKISPIVNKTLESKYEIKQEPLNNPLSSSNFNSSFSSSSSSFDSLSSSSTFSSQPYPSIFNSLTPTLPNSFSNSTAGSGSSISSSSSVPPSLSSASLLSSQLTSPLTITSSVLSMSVLNSKTSFTSTSVVTENDQKQSTSGTDGDGPPDAPPMDSPNNTTLNPASSSSSDTGSNSSPSSTSSGASSETTSTQPNLSSSSPTPTPVVRPGPSGDRNGLLDQIKNRGGLKLKKVETVVKNGDLKEESKGRVVEKKPNSSSDSASLSSSSSSSQETWDEDGNENDGEQEDVSTKRLIDMAEILVSTLSSSVSSSSSSSTSASKGTVSVSSSSSSSTSESKETVNSETSVPIMSPSIPGRGTPGLFGTPPPPPSRGTSPPVTNGSGPPPVPSGFNLRVTTGSTGRRLPPPPTPVKTSTTLLSNNK